MKIIAIGDTHGKDVWKKIVEKEKDADKIIFIGDYWDSFDIPFKQQYNNFIDIVEFKQKNPEQVVLLFGNHDYHYMTDGERYSGFQDAAAVPIYDIIEAALNDNLMQMAYFVKDNNECYLFTHAGLTFTWADKNLERGWEIDYIINKTFKVNPGAFKFTPSTNLDNYGDSITQSPIWVRPRALKSDAPSGFTQVVGHTKFKGIQIEDGFIFIDCLDYKDEYLIINDGVPLIGTV